MLRIAIIRVRNLEVGVGWRLAMPQVVEAGRQQEEEERAAREQALGQGKGEDYV